MYYTLSSKLLLTLSNFVALYPISKSASLSDRAVLLYACFSSVVHHSVEVRYYQPALWQWTENVAWWVLKNDVLASWKLLRKEWINVMLGFTLLLLSEIVMFVPFLSGSTKVLLRTLFHVPWHFLSLGYMAFKAVTYYQKEERLYGWLIRKMLGIVD